MNIKKIVLVSALCIVPAHANFTTHFTPAKLAGVAGLYVTAEALFDYYKNNPTQSAEDALHKKDSNKTLASCFVDALFANKRTWAVMAVLSACYLYKVCEEMPVEKIRPSLPLNTDGVEYNLCLPPDHSSIKKELYELVPYEIWENTDKYSSALSGTIKDLYGDVFAHDAEQKLLQKFYDEQKKWDIKNGSFDYHVIVETNIFYAERRKHLLLNFYKLLHFTQNTAESEELNSTFSERIISEYKKRLAEAAKKMIARYNL